MLPLGPRGPLCSTSADPFLRSARVNQTLAYTDEAFLAEVSLNAKLPCKRKTLAELTACPGVESDRVATDRSDGGEASCQARAQNAPILSSQSRT
jgi:hypothetical protein